MNFQISNPTSPKKLEIMFSGQEKNSVRLSFFLSGRIKWYYLTSTIIYTSDRWLKMEKTPST